MPCERLAQATLVTGLRVRYPYCDPDTDRFIRQLRTDWRHLPGQPKRILRAALARYVPREVWDVPKNGFNFPLRQFLSADDFGLVRRHLDAGRWRACGLLRSEVVQRYARRFIAGDPRVMFRVWALVTLGAWMEEHDDLL
jgi:asparagine synthase (glutamine-hydrolysing)